MDYFISSKNFQRTFFGRNGLKAEKLLEKYNGLAKEALSSGDKILSESYFQHADHFLRVVENQNSIQNNPKPHLDNSSIGENPSGQAHTKCIGIRNASSNQEWTILLPSPIYVTFNSFSEPNFS